MCLKQSNLQGDSGNRSARWWTTTHDVYPDKLKNKLLTQKTVIYYNWRQQHNLQGVEWINFLKKLKHISII